MRALVLQAFVHLIRHDVFLLRHDFAALHAKVHRMPVSTAQPRPDAPEPYATEPYATEKICKAVAYACIWYPKQVLCLQRSAVAVTMLRRYGIPAEMVIGAQRLPLKAHAWVEVGGRVVNDKPQVQSDYLVMERC